MKKLFLSLFLIVFAYSDVLNIENFEADLYSKDSQNSIKKITVSLRVSGRDINDNEAYVFDGLNVVIGSFYVEDLLTSMGKEKFKETFAKYTAKKHSVDIDEVLIISLKILREPKLEEILQIIREQGNYLTKNKDKGKNDEDDIIIKKDGKIELKPLDLNSIKNFGKDFGE
ncbi:MULTISPECIES: hypothetical protein [unclassified Campylobacter]|uniref:hypothetical protein n=1 Tax=unclassified Campylobacter TaxID=2593542 RepID=UPI0014521CE7|nr:MULTISPECIES: hypothetical protein [unclassified Campylobacter]QCD52400.1 hypothetical protein CDOMC_0774 [Campylobacter sp. RM16192]QKG29490.1 hypothetical protein CDOMF_1236 [Campylobacter sp. RM16187]